MKALVIRVKKGSVTVAGKVISGIAQGLCVFVGIEKGDEDDAVVTLAEKIAHLRIFENEEGKLHHSVCEKKYELLCISNFTLCADMTKGRRPSFEDAMEKSQANKYFENFVLVLQSKGVVVVTGEYGAHMDIALEFDGPVNIVIES